MVWLASWSCTTNDGFRRKITTIANSLCAFLKFSSTGFYGWDDPIIFLAEKFLTFASVVVSIRRVRCFDKGAVLIRSGVWSTPNYYSDTLALSGDRARDRVMVLITCETPLSTYYGIAYVFRCVLLKSEGSAHMRTLSTLY